MNYLFGAVLVLLSNATISVANVFDGELTRKTFSSIWSIVIINGLILLPAIPLMFFIFDPALITGVQLLLMLAIAAIDFFYQFPYYKALRYAETSVVTSFFSFGKILVPIFAYFVINERLTTLQYVGFGIIVLCSIATSFKGSAFKAKKAMMYMLPVVVILAMQSVLEKYGLGQIDWKSFYFYSFALSAPFYLVSLFFIRSARAEVMEFLRKPFQKKYSPIFIQNIATWVAGVFGTLALSMLPVTITKAVGSFHSLFVHFVASKGDKLHIGSKEKISIRKIILFLLIGIGVFLTLR